MFRRSIIAAILVVLGAAQASPAGAQEVLDGPTALGQLFNERRLEVSVIPQPFLGERELQVLAEVTATVPFYGAVAAAPTAGLGSETTSARGNYHSIESARAAALADCESRRQGGEPCVIVAESLPRNAEPRAFQLSQGATATFRRDYRRARGEKAFAISPVSGGFGLGTGPGAAQAAISACNAAGNVGDCAVVVAD